MLKNQIKKKSLRAKDMANGCSGTVVETMSLPSQLVFLLTR
jgi:hypothetical protein